MKIQILNDIKIKVTCSINQQMSVSCSVNQQMSVSCSVNQQMSHYTVYRAINTILTKQNNSK
jgi:hypothetical protein